MIRRILALGAALALVLALAACGGGESQPVSGSGSGSAFSAPESPAGRASEETPEPEPPSSTPLEEDASQPAASEEAQEGPTEEEAQALFTAAMEEIRALATEDPQSLLRSIFPGIEISGDEMAVDGVPYVRTTLTCEELAGYYGETFTGEALEWVLSTKFADVDGAVYCSLVGGQSGGAFQTVSVEPLEGNAWEGRYLSSGEEQTTVFEVEETAGGWRVASIDYRPAGLEG